MTVTCPRINSLILKGCDWVDSECLDYFSNYRSIKQTDGGSVETVLMSMAKGLRTDLRAKTKSRYTGKDQLYDVMKTRKVKMSKSSSKKMRFKSLSYFDLHGCSNLQDHNIETLLQFFQHLETLRIGRLYSITDASMKAVALHGKHLKRLDIRYEDIFLKS